MSRFSLDVIGKSFEVELKMGENKGFIVSINGKEYNANIEEVSDTAIWVSVAGNLYSVKLQDEPADFVRILRLFYHNRLISYAYLLRYPQRRNGRMFLSIQI